MIRVALADDHGVVRAGIKAVLASAGDIEVVGEATNGREAVELAQRVDPDVLVLDVAMAEMDGITAMRLLSSMKLRSRVLILTMYAEDDLRAELFNAGASGYLTKTAESGELINAVRSVADGRKYVQTNGRDPEPAGIRTFRQASDSRRFETLTDREQDVLRLVAAGFTAPEIGARLFISPKTVDSYKKRINEKLGFRRRADYVSFALSLGSTAEGVS